MESNSSSILELSWCFGINTDIPAHNLSVGNEKIIFYAASHAGILYDWVNGRQKPLMGHCNQITTIAVSKNKKWIVTADAGSESMLIVWELSIRAKSPVDERISVIPIKTIFGPHSKTGVLSAKFSPDSKYLYTLGNEETQVLAIWDWSAPDIQGPIAQVKLRGEQQSQIVVNPDDYQELMTGGPNSVNFFVWDPDMGVITQNEPLMNISNDKNADVTYTHSCFMPNKTDAVTVTSDGDVIVWSHSSLSDPGKPLGKGMKAAVKIARLHNGAINFVTSTKGKYIITGGKDGFIKIFDLHFRIVVWYEKLAVGPIGSISFSNDSQVLCLDIPELVVVSKHGKVICLQNSAKDLTLTPDSEGIITSSPKIVQLFESQAARIRGLAGHPESTIYAVGGDSSCLQIWNYTTKEVVISRLFKETVVDPAADPKKKSPQEVLSAISCIVFSPTGKTLAVGFMDGWIRILSTATLEDLPQNKYKTHLGYKVSSQPISRIVFSPDLSSLAFSDVEMGVGFLRKESVRLKEPTVDEQYTDGVKMRLEWVFVGRAKSHSKEVISLMFTPVVTDSEENGLTLLSVSQDRTVVEYDLGNSNIGSGIIIKNSRKIEQSHRPLAAMLMKSDNPVNTEHFLLTFNSGYKFKLYNPTTRACRKTVLGPSYADDIKEISSIPGLSGGDYLAFSSSQRVVGVVKLPLDGNPYKSMGLIAHPGQVSHVVPTSNGVQLLTAGGPDGTVYMWTINYSILETQIQSSAAAVANPFLNLLDSTGLGENGPAYTELEDYFYYAQLRSQGEDASKDRKISETVPLQEVPFIMQAMGFYASAQEIEDMVNEVKYSRFAEANGEEVSSISFEDLLKLYVNHRPYLDITKDDLLQALSKCLDSQSEDVSGTVSDNSVVSRAKVQSLLQQYGETMIGKELDDCLENLLSTSKGKYSQTQLPAKLTTKEFIQDVLSLMPDEQQDVPEAA